MLDAAHEGPKLGHGGTRRGDGDLTVVIEVADTGRGIAPAELPTIFEPFRQVGEQHFRPSTGVGLGLSIVKQLVEALGGSVSVTSVVGAGSWFRVEVPCALAESNVLVARAS